MKNFVRFFNWKYSFYLITFVVFFVWTFFLDGNSVIYLVEKWQQKRAYEEGIVFYEEQLKLIEQEQAEVMGNDDALEKFARENYLMKKEGETVFVLVDKDGNLID